MLFQDRQPIIFAHRGASAYAPENTIPAFKLASLQGADAVEFDVQLSADQEVVVFHDNNLERTTNGSGHVWESSFLELRKLDAGSFFDSSFQEVHIPTLKEVLDVVNNKMLINIELKGQNRSAQVLASKTASIVKNTCDLNRVIFSSFNPHQVFLIRKVLPESNIGFLTFGKLHRSVTTTLITPFIQYQAIHPDQKSVTYRLVETMHRHSKRVHVYTVNNREKMQELLQLGVDGIFTDDPLLARQVFDGQANPR